MISTLKNLVLLVSMALAITLSVPATGAAKPPNAKGQGEAHAQKPTRQRDVRHDHNRHYPPRDRVVKVLPPRNRPLTVRGKRYFYRRGVFYRPSGPGLVVIPAPIGAIVSVLPPGYVTLYIGTVPYFYANLTYYLWDRDAIGYRVVEKPADTDTATTVPNELFVYPMAGQSKEQLAKDRYECHAWAVDQTGYDPSAGEVLEDVARSDYNRAMTACLEARSYSVK